MELESLELDVHGMTCESCAQHVEKVLAGAPGVKEVSVPGWKSGRATVVAEGEVTADDLGAALKGSGYTVGVRSRKPLRLLPQEQPSGDGAFDLMIIGAGSAGFAAAIKAAELGRRVALVGWGIIGGTCVNVGCIPSKTLNRAVEMSHLAGQARFRGVHTAPGRISWPEVIAHKDDLVNQLRQEKYIDVLSAYPEITYYRRARPAHRRKRRRGGRSRLCPRQDRAGHRRPAMSPADSRVGRGGLLGQHVGA